LGFWGNDGDFMLNKGIEQGGLTHIRPSDNGHFPYSKIPPYLRHRVHIIHHESVGKDG